MTARSAQAAASPASSSRLRLGCGFLLEPEHYGRLMIGDCFTTVNPAEFIRAWGSQRAVPVQLFTGTGPAIAESGARVWRIIATDTAQILERARGPIL